MMKITVFQFFKDSTNKETKETKIYQIFYNFYIYCVFNKSTYFSV